MKGEDGKETTFQTKAVDAKGKQPVEEKVLKVVRAAPRSSLVGR